MVSAHYARNIVGIIGNVISFGLFLSPVPTFFSIVKRKAVDDFHPYPYLAAVLNCIFWIFYGLPIVHPDSTLVITINGIGLGLELIYIGIFLRYASKEGRVKVLLILLAEAIFAGSIATGIIVGLHTHEKRSMGLGIICDIFNIIMYASPLSIVKKVIETKSVEYMPGFLCLAGFLNGCIWLTYALIQFDIYLLVSNGLGALFGLVQLIIYAIYYKSTPVTKEEKQIQLSGQNAA